MSYQPPFTIANRKLILVAEIAEKNGRISNYKSFEFKSHLRRNNRILSIHSSLAIEANSLSLDEVRGVIAGKTVIGPGKEIQEVKNAYQAYDMLGRFDSYDLGPAIEKGLVAMGMPDKPTSRNQTYMRKT